MSSLTPTIELLLTGDRASEAWDTALNQLTDTINSGAELKTEELPGISKALLFSISQPHVHPDQIARAATLVMFRRQVAELLQAGISRDPTGETLWFLQPQPIQQLLLSPLLHRVLEGSLINHRLAEFFLSSVRQGLLHDFVTARRLQPEHWQALLPLLNALAVQGAMSEYSWLIKPEEEAALAAFSESLTAAPEEITTAGLLLLGAYQTLYGNELAAAMDSKGEVQQGVTPEVMDWHFRRPAKLAESRKAILTLGTIGAGISTEVGQQYEINPYPRWSKLNLVPVHSWESYLTSLLGHKPRPVLAENPDVLIAGCGTGKHPLHLVMMLPEAKVEAVDLSRSSLAYARMMAERYKLLDRISFHQADILALPEAGRTYDAIESVGVIHHMADPAAGLAALKRCLKPGGWLRLGLYSEAARWTVRAIRESYGMDYDLDDPQTLRQLRRLIMRDDSPAAQQAMNFNDFASLSGFRDLLFHRQEHRFTIPQIEAMLAQEGLEFMGFTFALPQKRQHYRDRWPEDHEMRTLSRWAEVEEARPELFIGMYNFWCRLPG
jgi:SAM-dependent methyltransferase